MEKGKREYSIIDLLLVCVKYEGKIDELCVSVCTGLVWLYYIEPMEILEMFINVFLVSTEQ